MKLFASDRVHPGDRRPLAINRDERVAPCTPVQNDEFERLSQKNWGWYVDTRHKKHLPLKRRRACAKGDDCVYARPCALCPIGCEMLRTGNREPYKKFLKRRGGRGPPTLILFPPFFVCKLGGRCTADNYAAVDFINHILSLMHILEYKVHADQMPTECIPAVG